MAEEARARTESVNCQSLELVRGLRCTERRKHTMARSAAFQNLARTIRLARFCDRHGLSTSEGLERAAALTAAAVERGTNRREFLAGAATRNKIDGLGTDFSLSYRP
jgi:hypothetical protein